MRLIGPRVVFNCLLVDTFSWRDPIVLGEAGPNPEVQDEGHAGSDSSDAAEFTTTAYTNVQENLKLPSEDPVIPEEPASSTGTMSSLQNLKKELSFTDHFFVEKKQEEEPGKPNADVEVQSMVLVSIHQDTSSVPPMTTLVIDLTKSQSGSPLSTSSATTSTVMTTTTIPPSPSPPQPQQRTADPTLMKRIDELEQHMTNLLQYNLALEESPNEEEEPGKPNADVEVQSMVLVSIHQDTSSVPPMTTLVKLMDSTDQDILCCRFCGVLFTAQTLTMLKGFGKSLFNPYTFLTDRKNLATASRRKKKTTYLLIPSI
nr:hypothetical protein [Tanacetum cinerariifolium]